MQGVPTGALRTLVAAGAHGELNSGNCGASAEVAAAEADVWAALPAGCRGAWEAARHAGTSLVQVFQNMCCFSFDWSSCGCVSVPRPTVPLPIEGDMKIRPCKSSSRAGALLYWLQNMHSRSARRAFFRLDSPNS